MRQLDLLRTLALSSVLIFALGGAGCTNEKDVGDPVEAPSVEATPTAEAEAEEAEAEEKNRSAKESGTETADAEMDAETE